MVVGQNWFLKCFSSGLSHCWKARSVSRQGFCKIQSAPLCLKLIFIVIWLRLLPSRRKGSKPGKHFCYKCLTLSLTSMGLLTCLNLSICWNALLICNPCPYAVFRIGVVLHNLPSHLQALCFHVCSNSTLCVITQNQVLAGEFLGFRSEAFPFSVDMNHQEDLVSESHSPVSPQPWDSWPSQQASFAPPPCSYLVTYSLVSWLCAKRAVALTHQEKLPKAMRQDPCFQALFKWKNARFLLPGIFRHWAQHVQICFSPEAGCGWQPAS